LQYLSLTLKEDEDDLEEEDLQEYRNVGAAIERIPQMRLCELVLSSIPGIVMENIVHPLLERCPRMEKLHLRWVCALRTLEHLAKTLKENKLPTLRHLNYAGEQLDRDAFDKVVSHIACGLVSLKLRGDEGCVAAPSLIQYHFRSLTSLKISFLISLWTLSDLMAGLPCLRTVRVSIYINRDDENAGARPFDKDWKCVDLRNLELYTTLYTRYNIGNHGRKECFEKKWVDYVFSQVGKLRSLQKLDFGCRLDVYRKKHGYLEQLAGLKQLKVLDLTNTDYGKFGKQEALWMAENWPKLLQ
ncbi:hypothetical protein BGX34_007529, partial [Mortierella sp. NVP85]